MGMPHFARTSADLAAPFTCLAVAPEPMRIPVANVVLVKQGGMT